MLHKLVIKIISLLMKAKSYSHILLNRTCISYIQWTLKWIQILQSYFNKRDGAMSKISIFLSILVETFKNFLMILKLEFFHLKLISCNNTAMIFSFLVSIDLSSLAFFLCPWDTLFFLIFIQSKHTKNYATN